MGVAAVIANPELGIQLVRQLVSGSRDIRNAVKKLPPEAAGIYAQAVADLHVLMAQLVAAPEGSEEAAAIQANLRHVRTTLDSLDAITKIKTYRATVRALARITKTVVSIALAVI
jgi:hypothetical protein